MGTKQNKTKTVVGRVGRKFSVSHFKSLEETSTLYFCSLFLNPFLNGLLQELLLICRVKVWHSLCLFYQHQEHGAPDDQCIYVVWLLVLEDSCYLFPSFRLSQVGLCSPSQLPLLLTEWLKRTASPCNWLGKWNQRYRGAGPKINT